MSEALVGKVALVTGGGRGVGAAVTDEFITEGAQVMVTDVDDDLVAAASQQLGDSGFAVRADVRDAEQMRSVCVQAVERFGSLDAVVANAGVGSSAKLGSITEEQFDFIFGVNVKGSLNTVQAALPHLKSGSAVVLIGSTAEIQAVEAMSLYAGSKAALRAMVRTWVKDTATAAYGSTCSASARWTPHRCVSRSKAHPEPTPSTGSSRRWARKTPSDASPSPRRSHAP